MTSPITILTVLDTHHRHEITTHKLSENRDDRCGTGPGDCVEQQVAMYPAWDRKRRGTCIYRRNHARDTHRSTRKRVYTWNYICAASRFSHARVTPEGLCVTTLMLSGAMICNRSRIDAT